MTRVRSLKQAALQARHDPQTFLALSDIFGDMGGVPAFAAAFARNLAAVWEQGARGALKSYLAGTL